MIVLTKSLQGVTNLLKESTKPPNKMILTKSFTYLLKASIKPSNEMTF